MSRYTEIIDNMMSHFTKDSYESEVLSAKKEFYSFAGLFDEESDQYEQKISQFSDWYLFTRPLLKSGVPPVQHVVDFRELDITPEESVFYKNLINNLHSLFEFIKLKKKDVYIKDLVSGQKIIVKDSEVTEGFEKGQIFEARLIPVDDNYVFTKSFCFHPPEVGKFILKEIKQVKKMKEEEELNFAKEELLIRLFTMRYKYDQYSHVDVKKIYTNDSKLSL